MSKYDDQLFDKINHIDEVIPLKLIQWPICMEVEKDKSWHKYEENGKHYIILKEEYYIDGKTLIRKSTAPDYLKNNEVREQYSLLWGNIVRDSTLAEYEFYTNQIRQNCVRVISEEEFSKIWQQVAESLEDFSNKVFNSLPIDSVHKKSLQKNKEENERREKFNNSGEDTESEPVPF